MSLKTDYKDAMFDGARKYRITENPDGSSGITDETTYTQAGDPFGANDINATNTEINKLEEVKRVKARAAEWSATAPYTQKIIVSGITPSDRSVVSLALFDSYVAANVKAVSKAYACLDRVVTGNGEITLYCYNKKPAIDFEIWLKGV